MGSVSKEVKGLALSSFMAYASVYIAKSILSAILPEIIESGAYSKEILGSMGSAFLIFYAIGQLVNGFLGDKFKAKYMITVGLTGSAVFCILFSFFINDQLALIIWGISGFLCSMLWGPLSKCIAESCSIKVARILMLLLTAASITGTMLAYVFATLAAYLWGWRSAFYLATGAIIISVFVVFIIFTWLEKRSFIKYNTLNNKKIKGDDSPGKVGFKYFLSAGFIPAAIAVMVNGVVRNAISFWIPTYINEVFLVKTSTASAISIMIPILNIVGAAVSYRLLKNFKDNEHFLSCALSVLSGSMFLVIFLIKGNGIAELCITIGALMIATAAMSGMCNLYFSVYVLRFAKTGRTSSLSGSLDFCAYAMASVANIAIGHLSVSVGWNNTVLSWIGVMVVGVIVCFYMGVKYRSIPQSG